MVRELPLNLLIIYINKKIYFKIQWSYINIKINHNILK